MAKKKFQPTDQPRDDRGEGPAADYARAWDAEGNLVYDGTKAVTEDGAEEGFEEWKKNFRDPEDVTIEEVGIAGKD